MTVERPGGGRSPSSASWRELAPVDGDVAELLGHEVAGGGGEHDDEEETDHDQHGSLRAPGVVGTGMMPGTTRLATAALLGRRVDHAAHFIGAGWDPAEGGPKERIVRFSGAAGSSRRPRRPTA